MDRAILLERTELLTLTLILVAVLLILGKRSGFFAIKENRFSGLPQVSFMDVSGGFLVFLGIELILVPMLAYTFLSMQAGKMLDAKHLTLNQSLQAWFNLLAVLASASGIIFYGLLLKDKRATFFGAKGSSISNNILLGASAWIFSYPCVLLISQIVGLALDFAGLEKHVDQVAVKHIKTTLRTPWIFWSTVASVVFLVPLAEEILFRGLTQRWLVQFFGRWKGIAIASALFALFHFSWSQKYDNIELLLSLFTLSCFLGFLYERQGSLWAPFGLHMTFNAISVYMIVRGELTK